MSRPRSFVKKRGGRAAGITLIELLVAMSIMTVISTMVVVIWVSLQDSFAYTTRSAEARATARDTMARMRREIRDAVVDPTTGEGPLVTAESDHIRFYSAFNDAGGNVQPVDYWYRATSATTGTITRQRGSGAELVVAKNIVNVGQNTPLFRYSYIQADGNPTIPPVLSVAAADVPRILTVQIHILADVNPGRSPVFMDLMSTVQPRNQRQF